jgi:hypothetical protein
MGALTSKTKQFAFRSWEQRSFKEIDDTEVSLFRVRVEKLKNKRIRILPLRYWIADAKRYLKEKELIINPLMLFKEIKSFFLSKSTLQEIKNIQYLASNTKVYNKIINKIENKKITTLNIFLGKKLSYNNYNSIITLKKNINLYSDLLYKNKDNKFFTKIAENNYNSTFEKQLNNKKELILLTNTRLDSPAFNSYLFQNADKYNYTSFSTFASNFKKSEIPLTTSNLINSSIGKINLTEKVVVTNLFVPEVFVTKFNIEHITLAPLYLQTNITFNTLKKDNHLSSINFNLGSHNKQYGSFFVAPIGSNTKSCISVPLNNNIFDHYFLTKINQKFLNRLFVLYYLIRTPNIRISLTPKFIEKKRVNNKRLFNNSVLSIIEKRR